MYHSLLYIYEFAILDRYIYYLLFLDIYVEFAFYFDMTFIFGLPSMHST